MPFEFATATRIVFGAGCVRELGGLASAFGKRAFVVMAGSAAPARDICAALAADGLGVERCETRGEPTIAAVLDAVGRARRASAELVIGIGGGSALDLGKAVAALLTNGGEPLDYLEVVGRGKPLRVRSAPYLAVPTTAGTGAEVTRNAVLLAEQEGVKASLRSPLMLPAVALVDPELTLGVPPEVTASTGLDALTQVIEPFVSRRANPLCDAICREGMSRAAQGLRAAFYDGSDAAAREDMALASLCGGLALANAALGAVHGFAAPLGGMLGARHGALCASLLPHVMAANLAALHARAPGSPLLPRYDEVGRLLTGRPEATAADGVEWVRELCAELRIPKLRELGLGEADLGRVVTQAARASSMKGNPIELDAGELEAVLRAAL